MTSYPRNSEGHNWEKNIEARKWLYQTPEEILIKASNGASDFGNKYGQPLINGSLLTFEHEENNKKYGYDKVIMLAGGVGFAKASDAQKDIPEADDIIVVLGGDNYRIGMGGGAVSSVATGEFGNEIELNAVQRANPEMQKRVANAIRSMCETKTILLFQYTTMVPVDILTACQNLLKTQGQELILTTFLLVIPHSLLRRYWETNRKKEWDLSLKPRTTLLLRMYHIVNVHQSIKLGK